MTEDFENHSERFSYSETETGKTTHFACIENGTQLGAATATHISEDLYDIGGIFVDPAYRNARIGTVLLKKINEFLRRKKCKGRLVNMIQGDAAHIYEANGWIKGEYKSHGAHGGYEYTYDGTS